MGPNIAPHGPGHNYGMILAKPVKIGIINQPKMNTLPLALSKCATMQLRMYRVIMKFIT